MLFFMFLASLPLGEKDCWPAADRAVATACCARGTGLSPGCLPDGFGFAECCPLGNLLPEVPRKKKQREFDDSERAFPKEDEKYRKKGEKRSRVAT